MLVRSLTLMAEQQGDRAITLAKVKSFFLIYASTLVSK